MQFSKMFRGVVKAVRKLSGDRQTPVRIRDPKIFSALLVLSFHFQSVSPPLSVPRARHVLSLQYLLNGFDKPLFLSGKPESGTQIADSVPPDSTVSSGM